MALTAIALGVGLASRFLVQALTPVTTQETEGPRLEDLDTSKSQFGYSLGYAYGQRWRINGLNIFWSPDIDEEIIEERSSQGGKGGGGVQTVNTTYVYTASFAAAIGDGPIESVNKIWLNGELWYSTDGGSVETGENNDFKLANNLEIRLGTVNQAKSPTIESIEGPVIPTFKRTAYLVFRDLPLESFGNRLPKVDVEFTPVIKDLRGIVADACQRGGLSPSEINVGDIPCIEIGGAFFKQDGGTTKQFLETLQRVYFFLGREAGGTVNFFSQQRSGLTNLNLTDLAAHEVGAEVPNRYKENIAYEIELPSRVEIEYKNIKNNLDPNLQYSIRPQATHENNLNLSTNLVMTDTRALNTSRRLLDFMHLQKRKYEAVNLLPIFAYLQPGEVVTFPTEGGTVAVQIEQIDIGANLLVSMKGVAYSSRILDLEETSPTEDDYTPIIEVPFYGDPTTEPLDVNLASDDHLEAGVYLPIQSDFSFNGAAIYSRYSGGSFVLIDSVPNLTTQGIVTQALPARDLDKVDRSTVFTVTLDRGELNNLTESEFYMLEQLALIGDEMVAIQNAIPIGPNTYQCSGLLRGRRGTEAAIGTHTPGESFYLLRGSGSARRIQGSIGDIGRTVDFKAVPRDRTLDSVQEESTLQIQGNAYRPYAPVNPKLTKFAVNDALQVEVSRRTRLFGDMRPFVDVSLSESIPRFRFDIYNGASVIRTVVSDEPNFLYASAQQIEDFGSVQDELDFDASQYSDVVGYGYVLEARDVKVSSVVA